MTRTKSSVNQGPSWCTCNFNFSETCYSVFSVLFIRECFNYIFSSFWHAPISCSNIISFLSAFSVCSCVRKGNYCCKEAICSESNSPNSLSPIESICKTSLQLSPYSVGLWRLWSFDVHKILGCHITFLKQLQSY